MIKRAHIRQFLAIIDSGSFTLAADRLGLTQPTLSAGLAELERLAGARLIERGRKQLRLTEAGARFLPIARGLERDFRTLDNFAKPASADWPDLKLGVLRTIAAPMFRAALEALAPLYRLEVIDGRDAELRAGLVSGRIQCAITLLRPGEADETAMPLLREPYCMMVPAGHRLIGPEPVPPPEFVSEIMIARRSCEMLGETSRFFTGHGVRPRFAYRSEDDTRCMAMVAAGQGMTTAPLSLAIDGAVPIHVLGYEFERRLGLVCGKSWFNQPGHAGAFRDIGERMAPALSNVSAS